MGKEKAKHKGKRLWKTLPADFEHRYVLSKRDSDEHYGRIVAVSGFPTNAKTYARVLAVHVSIEGIKSDLRILGKIPNEQEGLPTLIRPELDVFCYVVVPAKKPEIIRKGEKVCA